MSEDRDGTGILVFTIGHSNHGPRKFVSLVERAGIEFVMDVRSHPYSRFCPHFNRKRLEKSLEEAGIGYLHIGDKVGGKPDEKEFYDREGYVLYYRLARSERFRSGIEEIERRAASLRTAIMCAEEDPLRCHRRFLIGKILLERGVALRHIRGDGRIQCEEELVGSQVAGRGVDSGQLSLFQDEARASWKSPRPVRRKDSRHST